MTQFYALTPKQAIEVVEAAGVDDAASLIGDHVAAGLVRSYAQVQVTIDARGERSTVRGAAVAAEVWERMIRDGVDGDAWGGGTVRLAGSDLIGGSPAVHVTGFAFHPADVERLARQQQPTLQPAAKRRPTIVPPCEAKGGGQPADKPPRRRRPNADAIPQGAILCTIKQAGDALGVGRTKVNDFMNEGRLVRVDDVAGVRITVASVRALAGAG